jgi:hypothetical protein
VRSRATRASIGRAALVAPFIQRAATAALLLTLALGGSSPARAQPSPLEVGGKPLHPARPLLLVVDADDDDEDGVIDGKQADHIPTDELIEVVIPEAPGGATLTPLGGLRLIRYGQVLPAPLTLAEGDLPAPILLQATRPSQGGHPVALLVTQQGQTTRVTVQTVELTLLDANNRPLNPAVDALELSHRVTNDRSLPRGGDYDAQSADPTDVRVQLFDASAQGKNLSARLEAVSGDGEHLRSTLPLTLTRPDVEQPFRSHFVRLVGDDVDATARGVAGQVLRVGLRDQVRLIYPTPLGEVRQVLRVGRPGDESGPRAARQAALRVVVLRAYPGGPPVIGVDDLSALRIVREELAIANEIWLQCMITFGAPSETSVSIVDPPGPTMISVSDGDGLPARGGIIRFRVDGQSVGPIETARDAMPEDTAVQIGQALRALGYTANVTTNPPAVFGAGPSSDVLVRRGDGRFARIEAIEGVPLSTDKQQSISIGGVDLGDGMEEFDNMTAQSGTLEERTMIKALGDEDPSTIDLFIINRFTHGTRQGEAFIAQSSGPITNSLVLDRNGLRQRQTAWTLAHELGHVLLNQPLHPDNVGADVPMLLMDSDNNRGTVNGPKRLLPNECLRVRYESEARAVPPLLRAYDARKTRPRGGEPELEASVPKPRPR